eukprot:7225347-Lingulodinium_polyedra.AAC.1
MEGKVGLTDELVELILGAYHFHTCTDSRWVSVGASCASLVAALCLGLDKLVEISLSAPPK